MKKLLILFITVLILTGCSRTDKKVDYFQIGQDYLQKYEYDEAETSFQQGMSLDNSDERFYLARADISLKKGDYEKTLNILKEGYLISNTNNIANAIGEIYLVTGKFAESEEWYDKSLSKDESDIDALKGKAKVLAVRNDRDELKLLLDSINADSFDSELMLFKAVLEIDNSEAASKYILQSNTFDDNNNELSQEFRNALTAYTNAKTVHNLSNIAYILLNYGWHEIAQIPVSKITTENQFYETGYIYQGLIQLNTNQLDESLVSLSQALEINSNNIDTKIFQAQVFSLKNDEQNTFRIISELIDNTDISLTSSQYDTLQQICFDNNKHEYIERLYSNFSSKTELNNKILMTYVETLIELRKFNQADLIINELNSSKESLTTSENAKLKSFEAIISYNLNKRQEGLDLIIEAENIDKNIALIQYYKGMILKDNGEKSKAVEAFNRCIELDLKGYLSSLAVEQLNEIL